jgi:hypothetical protein
MQKIFYLSFPRKRESITLNEKAAFEPMDPRLRGGDCLFAMDTNYFFLF